MKQRANEEVYDIYDGGEYAVAYLPEDHPLLTTQQTYPEDVRLWQVRKALLNEAHELIKQAGWLNRDDPDEVALALMFQYQKILNKLYNAPAETEEQGVMYRVLRDPDVLYSEFAGETLINRHLSTEKDVALTKEEYEAFFNQLVAGAVMAKQELLGGRQPSLYQMPMQPPASASEGLGTITMMGDEKQSPLPYGGGRTR